jgi:predicted metalloprotease
VLATVFVVLIIGARLFKAVSAPEPVSPVALPTFTPFTPASPGTTSVNPPQPTTSTQETAEPTPTRPSAPVLNRTLKGNTLYRMGSLPSSRCPAGAVNISSNTQLKALILKTGQCLNREWAPALERLGIQHSPPHYAIVATRGRGACGDYPQRGSIVPFYCPRTTTIYASTSAMVRGSGRALGYGQLTPWSGGIISMMAHEYGHHVQYLTGLSDSWWRQTVNAGSESTRLGLSRRFELQATCFGGMFMRSVARSYPVTPARRAILYDFYSHVGDWPGYPRDHGSPANNNRWFRQGFDKNTAYQCNTWRAPSSTVS